MIAWTIKIWNKAFKIFGISFEVDILACKSNAKPECPPPIVQHLRAASGRRSSA